MNKKASLFVAIVFLVIIAGVYYFERQPVSPAPATAGIPAAGVSTNIYSSPTNGAFPGLTFSYPSSFGSAYVKVMSATFLNLRFQDEAKLSITFAKYDIPASDSSFQQWVKDNYGYTPGNPHNLALNDGHSTSTFETIGKYEAVKVDYDSSHNFYIVNLGTGVILGVGISGTVLPDSTKDAIIASIKFQ